MGEQIARFGIERHDLLEAFNTTSEQVLYSGFEVPLKVPRGSTKFTIEGKFVDGDSVFSTPDNCSECDGKMLITKIFGVTMD